MFKIYESWRQQKHPQEGQAQGTVRQKCKKYRSDLLQGLKEKLGELLTFTFWVQRRCSSLAICWVSPTHGQKTFGSFTFRWLVVKFRVKYSDLIQELITQNLFRQ